MSDCQHRNAIGKPNEYNVIREVVDGKAPHIQIGDTRHERARRWKLLKVFERSFHFRGESFRDFLVSLAIPGDRLAKLTSRGMPQAHTLQRDNTSL